MTVGLTTQQIDHICYQIGEWYLQWKGQLTDPYVPHKLGFAKEQLKEMICGDEYTDSTEHKTEVEKLQEVISFLENVSVVLGITHGGIAEILQSPDVELRGKLTDLFNKLSKDVAELYYSEPK